MAQLSLTEATILKEFLEDPTGELALRVFFVHKAQEFQAKCLDAVLNYDSQTAQEYAFKSNAMTEALGELKSFCLDQFTKR